MNSTEVQNSRRKLDNTSVYAHHMCLVLFLPVQSLLTCFRSSLTHFVDFVSNNSSSDSKLKAFLRFLVFSGSPTAVNRPLHALLYYTVGIPFWTTQSQTYKLYGKKHNTTCSSKLITHYCYIHVMERYPSLFLQKWVWIARLDLA